MTFTCHYDSPLGGITLTATEADFAASGSTDKIFRSRTERRGHDEGNSVAASNTAMARCLFLRPTTRFLPSPATFRHSFQQTVWQILSTIPYGETRTYKDIAMETARRLGRPHMAAQAVGNAIGHNPISILIPCHRIVGSNGSLTGYAGGISRKQSLLDIEHIPYYIK